MSEAPIVVGTGFAPTAEGEVVLTDPDEIWMRQANPAFVHDGEPSVKIFEESTRDGGKLSGARGSLTSAQDAFEHRESMGRALGRELTAGTWGVSVAELESAGVRAVDDSSLLEAGGPPGHAYVDYRHLTEVDKPTRRAVRAAILRSALKRGRLWPPPTD